MTSDNVFSDVSQSEKTLSEIIYHYMISDNVFSNWLTSLVTFFDKMLYSPRVTSSTKLNQRKRRDKSLFQG
jgi:hypothetical protein